MRKLTDYDMINLAGLIINGYKVNGVRIKRGELSDSDHYGIILGKSESSGNYATWQFHLEDEEPSLYWGHYFMEDYDAALNDFNTRDQDQPPALHDDYIVLQRAVDDYCIDCPDGSDDVCEGCHVRKMMDHYTPCPTKAHSESCNRP